MNEDSIKKFYENTKRINPSFKMEYNDFCNRMQDPVSRKKFYENTRKLNPAFRISDEEADAILGFTTSYNQQQEPKQSFSSKLLQNAGPFVPAGGNVYGMALAEKKEQERQAEEAAKRENERRHQAAMTIGLTDQDKEQMAQRNALKQKVDAEFLLDDKKFMPSNGYTPFNEGGSFNLIGTQTSESNEPIQAQKDLEKFERNMPSYLTRGEKTEEDIRTNAYERFKNTEEGKKAADEITQKYVEEFLQSEDFQRVRNNGEEAVYKEFNRLYEDRIYTEYSERVQSVMKDYIEDANERLGIKNTDNSVVGLDSKLQVLKTMRDEYNEFTDVSEKEIQERYKQEHGSTMQQDIKDPAAVMAVKQAYYEKIHNEKVEEALERGMIPSNANTLRHAEAYINKSKELIDAVKNDKGFFGAMGNTLSDIDTWMMGLTEIGRNLDVMNICKKVDENGGNLDVLSEDEQALLESVTTYMATCAYYSPQLNRAYKAGQTTAASIPFMLSIMLGSGFTKAAGQGFVKVLGKVAERMLGKYAEKQSIKVAGKVAGKAVETLVRSEIMTATFGAPKVAAGTIDRMTGDIGFRFSNDGKIVYNGREGQQNFGEALWNSHADTFIEYWSEDAFSILDPLGVAIKGSKWFGNIARKAEGNYILQDIIKLRNQPWLRNLRESTQFQSFPEEVLEEELGGVLRLISTTDTKVKNEDGTTNWEQTWKNAGLDIDSQIDIVLGLAPTSLFMGGVGAAGFYGGRAINYANFKKNLSSEEDKKLFQKIMKETRSGEFAECAHTLIRNILANDNLSVEQKREMILDVSSQYYKVMSGELQGMYRQTQVEPIIEATQHEGSDVIFNTTDYKGRKVCIVGGKLKFKQQDTENGPVDMLDKENSDEKVYVRVYGDDGSISKVYEVDAGTLTNPITNISNSDMREFLNAQKHAIFNGDKTFTVGDDTFNTDTGELIESNTPDNADTATGGNAQVGGGQQAEQGAEANELEGYLQPVNTRPHIMDRQFEIRMPNGTTRTVGITSRSVALKEDGTIDEKRSAFAIRNEKDKIILGDEKQQCLAAINAILLSERNAKIEQARQKKAADEAARASKNQGSEAAGESAGEIPEGAATDGQEPAGASGVQDDASPTPAAQEEGAAPVQDDGPAPAITQEQGEQQDEQPSEPTEEEQWNTAVAEATSMQKADGTFKSEATPEHKVVAMIGADKTGVQDAVDIAKEEIADIDNSLSTIDGNKKLSATDRLFRKRKLTAERQAWIDAIRKYVGEEAAASLETPAAPVAQETPAAVEGTPSDDNVQNNMGAEQASQENVQETVGDVSMGDTEGAPVAQSLSGNEERISETDAAAILKQIEDEAEEAEEIELTPENWYAQFGEDGIVETPIGKVKMGENQYLKLAQKGRDGKLGMIKPTLERPTIIIEDKSKANDGQKTERESSFIFVKAFIGKDGKRVYYFTSVTVKKDGQEVVISNQEKTQNRISKLIQQGKLTWINNNSTPHPTPRVEGSVPLNDSRKPTNADNQPTVLGINSSGIEENSSSADKGSENNPNDQTSDEENAEKVENAIESDVLAEVPINPMSSEYALVRTSNNRVEWARVGMGEAGNPILDEAGNPVYYSLNTNKPIKRTPIDKNIVYLKDANGGYQPYVLMSIIKPQDIKHHTRNTYRLMDMNGNTLDVNSNELFYQEKGSEEYVPAVESKKNTDTPDSILNTLIYNFKNGGAYRLSDLIKEGFTNIGRGRYITPYEKLMQRIANETGLKGVELADVTRSVNSVLNEAVSRWNRMVELRGYDEQLANSTGLDHNVMTSMYGDKRSLIIGNRFRKGTDTQNVDNPICQLIAAMDMAQQMGLIEEGTFDVIGENALRKGIPKKWLSKSDAKNEKEAEKATYEELVKQYNTLKKQRDALEKQIEDNPNMSYTDRSSINSAIDAIKNQMNDVADEMDMLDNMRLQSIPDTQHATVEQVNAVAEQLKKAMPNTDVVVAQDMEEATAVVAERTGMSEEEVREELGDGTVAGASLPDGSVVLVADSVRMDTAFHEFAHKLYAFAKKNGGPLMDAINKYIEQAPQAIKDYVSSHYPDAVGTDAYLDEVFAWALSEQSGKKIEQFLAERGLGSKDVMENMRQQAWYSRMWNAIKRLWNSIKTEFSDRFGSKYADLSVFDAYQTMSAEEIGNNLYDTLMGGKELAAQKNAKKSSKNLVNSKKNRNFAIVKSGKYNRLAINITQNAGEDRSANRLGELNEQDRLDYKNALSELRRTDITDEERKAAEDTIERIQSRRKEQMQKLVEEALKGIDGVRVAGISEGTGVYLNGEEEVIEYTSQVDLDVEEGQEDAVVAAMAMIAEVTKQDSFIVNYPDGITDKCWHSQQVHITTENPLTKQQVAKLSDEFTKHDLGVTIVGNEIYTGNFDDNLSNEDFVRKVNQIIEKFYKDGNAETSIRSTRTRQENVQGLDGIPFILGEQSLDGNTMLGTCKITARVNYSSFNAAKNEEDEHGSTKYLDRYGNETTTDRYYGEYYGGTEEEGSDEHPIQNTSITPSDLRKRLQGALISSDFSIEKKRIIERAKADGTYMKAPNGKPSNLSEDLWATTRTKSFKRWFGDWEKDPENASKVVDENGEPLVVYHGSRHAGFDMFMLNGSGSQGIYTTDSRDAANTYATNVSERRDGIQQGEAIIGAAEHHGIYPLFVNMKNPKRFDFGGREWDRYGEEHYIVMSDADELGDTPIFDTEEDANAYARTQGGEENGYYVLPKYATSDELLTETLQDGVYDGCIFTNYKDGHPRGETITSYVPFSSNQLKSSTQNSGEYSNVDARINHQIIGERGAAYLDKAEEATIRMDNLNIARQMESAGKDAKTIRLATGWERGDDGLWRYEIPNIGLQFTRVGSIGDYVYDMLLTDSERQLYDSGKWKKSKLSDEVKDAMDSVLQYPEGELILDLNGLGYEQLIKAYPEIEGMQIVPEESEDDYYGYFNPDDNSIHVNMSVLSEDDYEAELEFRNVVIHELQHFIQKIEGFENGGDIVNYESDKEYFKNYEMYRRLAGEVEARNAEFRDSLDEEERREFLLKDTEDVSTEDKIFLQSIGKNLQRKPKIKRKRNKRVFANQVPKSEIAVARKALFEARFGQRKLYNPIGVYSANYYHVFQNNTRTGSILIEGNEEKIKQLNKRLHNGTDTNREGFNGLIERIWSGQDNDNSNDAIVAGTGRRNAGTDNVHSQALQAGKSGDSGRDRGKVSRVDSAVSTRGRRGGGIRLQVTGGGYYSNSDFAPIDPKKAEAIKEKSEDMKHAVKTAMRKPSVVSKKTAAWLAAKTAAVLDRTEGVRRLDNSLDEWLKENGRKGTHMKYNVRQRIEAANSAIRYRVQQLEKKELRHLNEVVRNLVKEVEGSAMYNKYKIEKQPDVYGEQIYLTPVQFIERYLISRDNMERHDMGIDRGLKEFQERMGVDMATFMEEFERTYFSGKEGEAKRLELWNAIRDVTDISLNESLDSGIISEEAYNKMMNRKFYVPERDYAAKHDEDEVDGVVKRRGRNKPKPASMATEAEGGDSLADNVLAHIMDDAIDSITKAEKNRVKLCMYKMLTENKEWCREIGIPIPTEVSYVKNENGTYSRKDNAPTADERIAYAETMQTINELKNELLTTSDESVKKNIKSEIQKLEASLPYIDAATASKLFVEDAKSSLSSVCVMVDGVANEMIFPHMEYVADALNDRFNTIGQEKLIKKITGFIAAQFTVNNPTFFAVNICRDVPYVLRKGSIEYGYMFRMHFTKNFATSQRAVWKYLTDKETLDKETSQMLQRFLDSGGQMGYSNIPNIYDMKANVEALNEEGELRQKDGAYYTSMVLSLGTARLANILNDWSEIITRFAAYKSVIDMGLGHEEAMKASANLSCNFNRRGLGTPFFNFFSSLSMFVNAAVQGASSFYRSFDTMKHATKGFLNLMLGPAFFGFLSTLLSPDDDDEEFAISDFDRDNYFCLGNWRIPLSEQIKPFFVIGVNVALGMRGRRDSSEIANSVISSFVRNLLPLPQNITNTAIMFTELCTIDNEEFGLGKFGKMINSALMPEALKTSVQLAQNENFFGNKIRYNTGDRPQIDFDDNEAQLYQDVCELFYLLGGGKEGSHSLTREDGSKVKFDFGAKELKQYMFVIPQGTQDMLLTAYGIGKAAVQSVRDDVPMSDALKENVRWRDVPIVNRFYHPTDSALFRYSVKKEATSLVNDRRIVIDNITREVRRYSKMKEDATNSGNLELAAEMNDALESEIRKLNNVLTTEYKNLEELVDVYNKINYSNVAKKSLNMNEKEFKKKFPDIDYENIDDNLKNLASGMLTFMYIMDGNERIDKKIPDKIRGKLGGAETVKEYFDKKKAAGE